MSEQREAEIAIVMGMLPTQTSLGPGFDKRTAATRIVDALYEERARPNKYARAMRKMAEHSQEGERRES